MTQRIIPKEEEEEPRIVEIKSIDEKNEKINIYVPPGIVQTESSLTHLIYDTFSNLAGGAKISKKKTNNTKLGDVTRPPEASL